MTITNTLVILKPDALKRHLVGDIINRFEKRGLTINTLKHTKLTRDVLDQHYAHIKDKPFYPEIVDYMLSGPVIIMSLSAPSPDVTRLVRDMVGATNPAEALPGTIRGDFGIGVEANLVHASDSLEAAIAEHTLHFLS